MIKEVKMYSVVCDRCGNQFVDEFNGIVAWLDEGTAKEQAMESEWAEIGDKHYCPTAMSLMMSQMSMFLKRKEINMAELKVGERVTLEVIEQNVSNGCDD